MDSACIRFPAIPTTCRMSTLSLDFVSTNTARECGEGRRGTEEGFVALNNQPTPQPIKPPNSEKGKTKPRKGFNEVALLTNTTDSLGKTSSHKVHPPKTDATGGSESAGERRGRPKNKNTQNGPANTEKGGGGFGSSSAQGTTQGASGLQRARHPTLAYRTGIGDSSRGWNTTTVLPRPATAWPPRDFVQRGNPANSSHMPRGSKRRNRNSHHDPRRNIKRNMACSGRQNNGSSYYKSSYYVPFRSGMSLSSSRRQPSANDDQSRSSKGGRKIGMCKAWDTSKGYGFLVDENKKISYFCHWTQLTQEGFRKLDSHRFYEFEIGKHTDGRIQAENVTRVGGCELTSPPTKRNKKNKKKRESCMDFRKGGCIRGEGCKYTHNFNPNLRKHRMVEDRWHQRSRGSQLQSHNDYYSSRTRNNGWVTSSILPDARASSGQ